MATPDENPNYAPKVRSDSWAEAPNTGDFYIKEIKRNVRQMPYGDFMEMVWAVNADATKLWGWANSTE